MSIQAASASSPPLLEVRDLRVRYGPIIALKGIDVDVFKGEIVSIIGANGAGKSTLLRTLSGLVRPAAGSIRLNADGEVDLCRTRAHRIVELGIAHAPEGRRIFTNMTVLENLQLGAHSRRGCSLDDLEQILLTFPRLKERLRQSAGTLSGGEQQMLAIGRALMAKPRILLLDEPSLGLAPFLVKEIFRIIKSINSDGTTVLLVEQNAHMALEIAHRGYCLETGIVKLADTGANLLKNPAVRDAYLGGA